MFLHLKWTCFLLIHNCILSLYRYPQFFFFFYIGDLKIKHNFGTHCISGHLHSGIKMIVLTHFANRNQFICMIMVIKALLLFTHRVVTFPGTETIICLVTSCAFWTVRATLPHLVHLCRSHTTVSSNSIVTP